METPKKQLNWMGLIYGLKFALYGAIAAYDYSIGSKYTLAWLILAAFMLSLFTISEIKHTKD